MHWYKTSSTYITIHHLPKSGYRDANPTLIPVPLILPSTAFALQFRTAFDSPIEALPGQHIQFNLGHIQPAAMFRRMVYLKPSGQSVGLIQSEPFVKRTGRMRVQVIHDQNNLFCLWIHDIA